MLFVDDDRALRDAVGRALRLEGYDVVLAAEGGEALRLLAAERVDVVVLDVNMPTMNGIEVCRRIRSGGDRAAILMLTARDGIADRVAGLNAGADDYLVKPFALSEFLARVRAGMRRRQDAAQGDGGITAGQKGAHIAFADLRLDLQTHEAFRAARPMTLTRTEFQLLELFIRNPRTVLTRELILDRVWGGDLGVSSKVVDVFVSHLRRKMETTGEPRLLRTVHAVGYVLREAQ